MSFPMSIGTLMIAWYLIN